MKKILVFGATGGTGKQVVTQALRAGYAVTVVLRNPAALDLRHPQLEILQGDVFKPPTFEQALRGKEAVISCLGISKNAPTTVYSKGMQHIIAAMHGAGVRRLICISSVAIIVPPKASWLLKFMTKNMLQRQYNFIYADMLAMEKILEETDLNWTIIRAPWLWDTAHTGKYRTAVNEHLRSPFRISRADLGEYMVQHIGDEKTNRARVEISY